MKVQKFPQHLLLGEDDPALWSRRVDGDDQHNSVPGRDEVLQDELLLPDAGKFAERFPKFVDAFAGLGRDKEGDWFGSRFTFESFVLKSAFFF